MHRSGENLHPGKVDYFAGNLWGKKTYRTGTGANSGEVTVEISGDYYGYNQIWGTVEAQVLVLDRN